MLVQIPRMSSPVQLNGWMPDPQDGKPEVNLLDAPLGVADLPTNPGLIDNSSFFKDISFQAKWPSCTANAGADLWEAVEIWKLVRQRKIQLIQAKAMVPDKSRMFLWWNGRNELDPCAAGDATSGCYNRLIMDIVGRHGVPCETTWPYDDAPCGADGKPRTIVRPSIQSYREAFCHRSTGSYKIFDTGANRVDRIIQTLQVLPGVAFGTSVGSGFGAIGAAVAKPADKAGRHAMVICGWNQKLGAFKVRNSWGNWFGEAGYCWMSADYITWSETSGLWVVTG